MAQEMQYEGTVRKGDKDARGAMNVKRVQEWLCLHGVRVAIDGDFGPATEKAVRQFQAKNVKNAAASGVVCENTFNALVSPMRDALAAIDAKKIKEPPVCTYARRHLAAGAREVGGQNKGPWVRLYMNGNEGRSWPWCAGFVTFVLKQAAGGKPPIAGSFDCDTLASQAKRAGLFLSTASSPASAAGKVRPGSIFLLRKSRGDWMHTGIVTAAEAGCFNTIEGNTNDSGSREGYEVATRVRAFRKPCDFIVFK